MKAFAAALESMKKPTFSIGKIAPTPGLVNQFFNDSTGSGDEGEIDTRGAWNEGGDWEFVQSPALSAPSADADTWALRARLMRNALVNHQHLRAIRVLVRPAASMQRSDLAV